MNYSQEFENISDLIHNASVGIHFVNSDGIIIYANSTELEMLGYTEEEYIGHHTSEFQLEDHILCDMMARLGQQETLKNYPAKVKAKQGVKYILFNSTAYFKDEKFVHTRCFAADIYKPVYDAFVSHSEYFK